MQPTTARRILVVANRTADAPRLLKHIRARAAAGPCEFTLLVPDATDREAGERRLEIVLPLLSAAASTQVEGLVGGPDPFEAVRQAVREGDFDEIIVSTLPRRTSKWLARDLIRQIQSLRLPVTPVVPGRRRAWPMLSRPWDTGDERDQT